MTVTTGDLILPASFSLQSLTLLGWEDDIPYPAPFARSILAAAAETLTYLALPNEPCLSGMDASLPLVASSLRSLEVGGYAASSAWLEALGTLSQLESLSFAGDLSHVHPILAALSLSTLRELRVEEVDEEVEDFFTEHQDYLPLLDCLNERSVAALRTLCISTNGEDYKEEAWYAPVAKACKKRGIRLRVR